MVMQTCMSGWGFGGGPPGFWRWIHPLPLRPTAHCRCFVHPQRCAPNCPTCYCLTAVLSRIPSYTSPHVSFLLLWLFHFPNPMLQHIHPTDIPPLLRSISAPAPAAPAAPPPPHTPLPSTFSYAPSVSGWVTAVAGTVGGTGADVGIVNSAGFSFTIWVGSGASPNGVMCYFGALRPL